MAVSLEKGFLDPGRMPCEMVISGVWYEHWWLLVDARSKG